MSSNIGTIRSAAYKDQLLEIANQVNSAPGIKEILVLLRDKVPPLVNAQRVTVFALDVKNQQLYSLMKVGDELKEIRVPKNFSSIAGFTALSKMTVNIKDAYDSAELTRIHANLAFDQRWDKQSGFRTRQVVCTPILFEKYLMGVLQAVNKKVGDVFTGDDEAALREIARILGVALYNQRRVTRQNQPNKYGNLIDKGVISEKQLEEAVALARINVRDIGSVLAEKYSIPKEEIGQSLAVFYSTKFFSWDGSQKVPDELKERLSADFLTKNVCVPISKEQGTTTFVVEDPFDLAKLDNVKVLGISPRYEFWVGLRDDIIECVQANYGLKNEPKNEMDEILSELTAGASGDADESEREAEAAQQQDEVDEGDSAIVRLANQIIRDGYKKGASDIHIEPYGATQNCIIRLRIDGDCQPYMEIPGSHRNALVSRFKIMAKLDIAEKRKPQDGKIRFKGPMGQIELRVACVPTTNNNEDIVMRILAASKPLPMENLGMSKRNFEETQKLFNKPYGIFLCVGPTGSGKTTTLHSCVGYINTPDMKIWTVEDPVEITQRGLRQVEINKAKDVTFAIAMKAFLRADPDVIMVGEMRDAETAGTGVEASLTGHLVVSTLHTNSAPETITRLLDMGLDPFNFADALLGILAQRLAKTLCGKCKEPYKADDFEIEEMKHLYGEKYWDRLAEAKAPEIKLYRPKGCPECNNSGYKGRVGLHELLVATDPIKRLIAKRSSIDSIREVAIDEGMTTLLQDGIWKVFTGRVDLKSVKQVCIK
jgi:type II secretory ATPase GspE/PulE/Tfp pilus assembly ATPase PilB-like protein